MNKQIEEMAKVIIRGCRECNCEECKHSEGVLYPDCVPLFTAEALYKAGYRKASEVAREIFAEIERRIVFNEYGVALLSQYIFDETRKKYESEGAE